jgi:hypothetical protein
LPLENFLGTNRPVVQEEMTALWDRFNMDMKWRYGSAIHRNTKMRNKRLLVAPIMRGDA